MFFTKELPTSDMKVPNTPVPMRIMEVAIIRPCSVIGYVSSYPIMVSVATPHQSASPNDANTPCFHT